VAASAPSATAAWQPSQATSGPGGSGARTRPFRFGLDDGATRDVALAPGAIVGERYRIVQLLGEGGMGRVYEAEHVVLGHKVAVKLLRRDRQNAEHLARFRQEAEAAGRIGHPAIARVSDFGGRDEPYAYMVMELLRGESLEEWLSRPGRLQAGLEPMVDVARGLQAAHAAGVVHRDLKPANLFLHRGADGRLQPKILDFGIAKLATTEHTAIATAAGTVLGTPYYIAPERALGRALDARADLYSLGVILYEMTTGTVPFVDATFMGVLAKHVKMMPLDPRQAAPDRGIPDGLAQLTMSLLAKDPASRPATAEAVASELERLLVAERDAIASVVTGPREPSSDGVATVYIDEIAERPTTVPGDVSSQDTVSLGTTPSSSGSVPVLAASAPAPVAREPALQSGRTRALGSNAMRDGLPRAKATSRGGPGAFAIAAVVIGVGGLAGWWIAREGTRATASDPPRPANVETTAVPTREAAVAAPASAVAAPREAAPPTTAPREPTIGDRSPAAAAPQPAAGDDAAKAEPRAKTPTRPRKPNKPKSSPPPTSTGPTPGIPDLK
jgi:serine/threonine-protein kinase